MTKYVNYYDELGLLECPRCGWTGPFEAAATQVFREFTDAHCPQCEFTVAPMLAIRMHPTLREMIEHGTAAEVERAQRLIAEDEAFWRVALTRPEQLPDLPGQDDLYLVWDAARDDDKVSPRTIIRDGDHVLFSEPGTWEAIDGRFEAICEVLRQKYKSRVRDLIPTRRSELYLFGDSFYGETMRRFIVTKIFGPQPEMDGTELG